MASRLLSYPDTVCCLTYARRCSAIVPGQTQNVAAAADGAWFDPRRKRGDRYVPQHRQIRSQIDVLADAIELLGVGDKAYGVRAALVCRVKAIARRIL